jgi:hypothetical protein
MQLHRSQLMQHLNPSRSSPILKKGLPLSASYPTDTMRHVWESTTFGKRAY